MAKKCVSYPLVVSLSNHTSGGKFPLMPFDKLRMSGDKAHSIIIEHILRD